MWSGFIFIPLVVLRAVYLLAAIAAAGMGFWIFLPSMDRTKKMLSLAIGLTAASLAGLYFHPWNPMVMTMGVYEIGFRDQDKINQAASFDQIVAQTADSLAFYAEGRETVVTVKRLRSGYTIVANNC